MNGVLYFSTVLGSGLACLAKYTSGDPVFVTYSTPADPNSIANRCLNLTTTADAIGQSGNFSYLTPVDGTLYFSGMRLGAGVPFLFKYTPGDPVIDYWSRVTGNVGYPRQLTAVDDTLYFTASTGVAGAGKVYKYKVGDPAPLAGDGLTNLTWGTSGGTSIAKGVGTSFFFDGKTTTGRNKLFVYTPGDPMIGDAAALSDINPGGNDVISSMVEFMGKLYFIAGNGTTKKLYSYQVGDPVVVAGDAMSVTTTRTTSGSITAPIISGEWLYYGHKKLYRLKTGLAPEAVTDINPGLDDEISNLVSLGGGRVAFSAKNVGGDAQLYVYSPGDAVLGAGDAKSDTNGSGSDAIQTIYALGASEVAFLATNSGGDVKLFYYALGGAIATSGSEVSDINSGGNDTFTTAEVSSTGVLFFVALDGSGYDKVYIYRAGDPTVTQVSDINLGDLDGIYQLKTIGNTVYFTAVDYSTCFDYRLYAYTVGGPIVDSTQAASDTGGGGCDSIFGNLIAGTDEIYFLSLGKLYRYKHGASGPVQPGDMIANPGNTGIGTVKDTFVFRGGALYFAATPDPSFPDIFNPASHVYRYLPGGPVVTDPFTTYDSVGLEQADSFSATDNGFIVFDLSYSNYRIDLSSGDATSWAWGDPTDWLTLGDFTIRNAYGWKLQKNPDSLTPTDIDLDDPGLVNDYLSSVLKHDGSLYILADPCGGAYTSCAAIYRYGP